MSKEQLEEISKAFHDFIHNDTGSGTEEIIAETNSKVAGKNVDVLIWLQEGYGEKYFYECMSLAENVIKSFERYPDEELEVRDENVRRMRRNIQMG